MSEVESKIDSGLVAWKESIDRRKASMTTFLFSIGFCSLDFIVTFFFIGNSVYSRDSRYDSRTGTLLLMNKKTKSAHPRSSFPVDSV